MLRHPNSSRKMALEGSPGALGFTFGISMQDYGCAWVTVVGGHNQKCEFWESWRIGAALGGCASSSAEIAPAYISPVMYQQYTCAQLAQEAQAVSQRAGTLSGVQDQKRTNDGLATAAVVIFWPAAFFVGGDKQTAAELAQMKGQMVAIEQASIQKKCGIQFQGKPPGA
jgi:hypothetical protein